jgi:hypothetical protein
MYVAAATLLRWGGLHGLRRNRSRHRTDGVVLLYLAGELAMGVHASLPA